MATNNNEHLATTAQQTQEVDKQRHASGEKEQPERTRVHRSIYLERTSYERLDEAYKKTRHQLYPLELRKSAFIEACIAYALDHLPDIKTILRKDL